MNAGSASARSFCLALVRVSSPQIDKLFGVENEYKAGWLGQLCMGARLTSLQSQFAFSKRLVDWSIKAGYLRTHNIFVPD
jgi:hypothetical protein